MSVQHFHKGELHLQEQTGMRARIDVLTQHMMRSSMPDEHRLFYEGLEYILIGTIGADGLPYASMVTGAPGFASSPDPDTLVIRTGARDDLPAFAGLRVGEPVGIVGIDLSNRRRNRMHGRLTAIDAETITIVPVQSYGNCPKYINIRELLERAPSSPVLWEPPRKALSPADMGLIATADTFFIASFVRDGSGAPYEGVDVNHRGGHPGFVAVDGPTTLLIPDYRGNYLFNTLGNLLVNPSAGLLFVDFEDGDQLQIQGKASILEDAVDVGRFPGATRLLRIEIEHVRRADNATPLRWRLLEFSPVNPELREKEL